MAREDRWRPERKGVKMHEKKRWKCCRRIAMICSICILCHQNCSNLAIGTVPIHAGNLISAKSHAIDACERHHGIAKTLHLSVRCLIADCLHAAAYRCDSAECTFCFIQKRKSNRAFSLTPQITSFHNLHAKVALVALVAFVCKHMCHPIHKSRRCAPQYISTSLTAPGAARERGSRPDRHG